MTRDSEFHHLEVKTPSGNGAHLLFAQFKGRVSEESSLEAISLSQSPVMDLSKPHSHFLRTYPVLRSYSWQGLGDPMGVLGIEPIWSHAK